MLQLYSESISFWSCKWSCESQIDLKHFVSSAKRNTVKLRKELVLEDH